MCGLVGLWSKKGKPVGQQVFELYMKQRKRGLEGYGFLAINAEGKLKGIYRAKSEAGIKKLLMKAPEEIILFHHRFPTSTENTLGTTHPIPVKHEELEFDWFFAHNGGISNKDRLKEEHNKLGYVYTTEFEEKKVAVHLDGKEELLETGKTEYNDSEVLAIEMARYLEGKTESVDTLGPVAFWGVQLKKGTNEVVSIFYGHNHGRELNFVENKKYKGIASENGKNVEQMKIYSYDTGNPQLYVQDFDIEKCKPVKVVHHAAPSTNVRTTGQRDRMNKAYCALENKEHTYEQMVETGLPVTAFDRIIVDNLVLYIPKKYARFSNATTKYVRPSVGFSNDNKPDSSQVKAVKERLEELCIEYAKISSKVDKIDDSYNHGYITESERDKTIETLEKRGEEIQEVVYTLGLEENEVEDMLGLCMDMEDYNESYKDHVT